jgi:hypothetical protein
VLELKTLAGFAIMMRSLSLQFDAEARCRRRSGPAGSVRSSRLQVGGGPPLFGCDGIVYAMLMRRVPLTIA